MKVLIQWRFLALFVTAAAIFYGHSAATAQAQAASDKFAGRTMKDKHGRGWNCSYIWLKDEYFAAIRKCKQCYARGDRFWMNESGTRFKCVPRISATRGGQERNGAEDEISRRPRSSGGYGVRRTRSPSRPTKPDPFGDSGAATSSDPFDKPIGSTTDPFDRPGGATPRDPFDQRKAPEIARSGGAIPRFNVITRVMYTSCTRGGAAKNIHEYVVSHELSGRRDILFKYDGEWRCHRIGPEGKTLKRCGRITYNLPAYTNTECSIERDKRNGLR